MCITYIIQEPVSIELGSIDKWKGHGRKRRYVTTSEAMMYVPLLETIQTQLQDDVIWKEVGGYMPKPFVCNQGLIN